MEAATLGALFLLAAIGPAFLAGGLDHATLAENDPWRVVIGIIGAVGIGALLRLTGRAVWETVLPYSPQGGLRRFWTRVRDFRAEIARDPSRQDFWDLASPTNTGATPFISASGAPALVAPTNNEPPWSYGHRVVIAAEYFLYSRAPDGLLQWIRRRYERFVDAISAAVAILLGVTFGVLGIPNQDVPRMVFFDGVLVLVAAFTFAYANENRRLAQQMETYWYNLTAYNKTKGPQFDFTSTPSPAGVQLIRADLNIDR
jgi:hypothetical protein